MMDSLIKKIMKNKLLFAICSCHILLSFGLSLFGSFFIPIRENVGWETMAYNTFETGVSLNLDELARNTCKVYSYIFAALLIIGFWILVFQVVKLWKENVVNKNVLITLFIIFILGLIFITIFYPYPINSSFNNDTRYNYVYCKEYMPMYWHAFFTNVFHIACMIFINHPISMILVQYTFSFAIICYLIYQLYLYYFNKEIKPLYLIIVIFILLCLPSTIKIMLWVGRNFSFGIFTTAYFGIFIIDYLKGNKLSVSKFLLLSLLLAIMSTWRSEGLIFIPFFPIFLVFVYKIKIKNVSKIILGVFIAVFMIVSLYLPNQYGANKYQGNDYMIINTPGSLAAVIYGKNPNLSYKGADEDLKNIDAVIPLEWIKAYGGSASTSYNVACGRSSRQCDAYGKDKAYVKSAYSILLHNLPVFMKYQINQYLRSISFGGIFKLFNGTGEDLSVNMPKSAKDSRSMWLNYYDVGAENLENGYPLLNKNKFHVLLTKAYNYFRKDALNTVKYFKPFLTLLAIAICFLSLFKKEWFWMFLGGNILGIFMAIVIFAPSAREDYYLATFYNQMLFVISYILYWQKNNKGLKK